MTRYRWVAARKAEGFPTTAACDVVGAGRQAFRLGCSPKGGALPR